MDGSRTAPQRQRLGMLVFIFLLAFLPRAIYPVSRTHLWYQRSIRFSDAILERDWANTYQQYHPGVTTMWLSGIGIKLFGYSRDLTSTQLLEHETAPHGTAEDAYAAGIIPLALAISLGITLTTTLVGRLVKQKAGYVAGILLASDPLYLTHSKVLHVDALLATLMLISALYLILYAQQHRRRDLVLSALFAGLAILTKSPALFLIPYAFLLVSLRKPEQGADIAQRLLNQLRHLLHAGKILIIWGVIAAAIFFLLFPSMWVNPGQTLQNIERRGAFHVVTAHYNAIFFNGQIISKDPGPLFYLATILWKTTWITLPTSIIALGVTLKRLRHKRHNPALWWLIIYAGGFSLQMMTSARKEIRYLLPVFPAIDVLAAYGLVELSEALGRMRQRRLPTWLPTGLLTLALCVQAIIVLSHHPYYGTHFNYLLGGPRAAKQVLTPQDQGEGLDQAARYLNALPNAEASSAVMHALSAEMFYRYFIGTTDPNNVNPDADYRVYTLNQTMRHLGDDEWEQTWLADQKIEPLWTKEFGGLTYVWIYGTPPE